MGAIGSQVVVVDENIEWKEEPSSRGKVAIC